MSSELEPSLEEITICIGTEEKTRIPCKVLMHSILKRTTNPIKFCLMEGKSWTKLSERKLGEGTGFSLARWRIPENLDYKGFAIYLDADQLCLSNIVELWNQNVGKPLSSIYCTYQGDKWFKEAPNTSVMLIDCEQAKKDWWPISKIEEYLVGDCPKRTRYVKVMHALHLEKQPEKIPNLWNQLNEPKINGGILHFTVEPQQPWYQPKHPFRYLWAQELHSAIKAEVITREEIMEEIKIFKPHTRLERGKGIHPYYKKWVA